MATEFEYEDFKIAVDVVIDSSVSQRELPALPPCNEHSFYLQDGEEANWRLLYLVLDGCDNSAFERALGTTSKNQADFIILELIGKPSATVLDCLAGPCLAIT